jgi:transcription initiation factor TFIIIB Brf1 subunit/transcription initiation factor TFIIB
MARKVLASWRTSNIAQDEYSENLGIVMACPECKEDSANTDENPPLEDIICKTCGLALADRIIDTRAEWDPVFDNDPIATNYSASYPAIVTAHRTVSEYPDSNYSKNEYPNSDHAEIIIKVMLIETRTTKEMITGLRSEAVPAHKPLTILGHRQ